jgi:hypothetical protein
MALSAKEQEIVNTIKVDVLNAWKFVHRFVWPALVGGIIIGAVLEHFVKL